MKRNTNILLAIGLILAASLARIVNTEMHLYNFAPVAAIGLFSGAVIKDKRLAVLIPLLSLLSADLYFQFFTKVSGFYGIQQWFVYGGMALVALMGSLVKRINPVSVLTGSLAASVVFFIVSNFGSFLYGMYGHGVSALITTYVAGIPFFKHSLAGDLAGGILLFGLYVLAQRSLKAKAVKA